MNILIGCENSQIVSNAFRNKGHDAYSCDLNQCNGNNPKYHLQMDIFDAIKLKKWDFIGLHPPCEKITNTSNRHYAPGKLKHQERINAVEWTIKLWNFACENAKMVYLENPTGALNTDKRLPKPQMIQPYFFGDKIQKKTYLWLHNLKPLTYSLDSNLFENKTCVEPEYIIYNSKKTKSGKSKYSIFGKMSSS